MVDPKTALFKVFSAWGAIFLLGFLLVHVAVFHVFIHWIPLVLFGFYMSKDGVRVLGKPPFLIIGYWLVVAALAITLTGLVFTGTIPYPAFIPLWGVAILGFIGLAHTLFGFWVRNRSFALIGALWMIIAAVMWGIHMSPGTEVIILAFVTSIPYFTAALSLKTKNSSAQ